MRGEKDIWFPAKRLGYGWGLPVRWQGWVVLLLYCVLMGVGTVLLRQTRYPNTIVPYMTVLTALLICICVWKGEPPHWPWEKD